MKLEVRRVGTPADQAYALRLAARIEAARRRTSPDTAANAVEIVAQPFVFDRGLSLEQKLYAAKWRAAKALGIEIDKPKRDVK
jgi:hypothetical protein